MSSLFNMEKWSKLFSDSEIIAGFFQGLKLTIIVSFWGLLLALVLGVIFGVMSVSKNKLLRGIARVYVEFFQNTPLVLQTFFYYYSLPALRRTLFHMTVKEARLPAMTYGIMGVGIYHGAYISEVIRAGIEAVPKGQLEAAYSQGFTTIQAMRYIILPQTFKMILPPFTNQALNLVKNSSVVALIGGFDLMYKSNIYVCSTSNICGYFLCAFMYFIICFPLARLTKYLEVRAQREPVVKTSKRTEVA